MRLIVEGGRLVCAAKDRSADREAAEVQFSMVLQGEAGSGAAEFWEYAGELKGVAEQMPAQTRCEACIEAGVAMDSTESRVARRGRILGERGVPAGKGEKSGVYELEL